MPACSVACMIGGETATVYITASSSSLPDRMSQSVTDAPSSSLTNYIELVLKPNSYHLT